MSTFAIPIGRPTLADHVFSRSLVTDIVLILAGTALTALASQMAILKEPVPITLQTFSVLLVASSLGAVRGALSMGLYLLLGVVGLPIFADGKSGNLFSLPSGGYIIGFVLAAIVVGWLAQLQWDHKVLGTILSFTIGSALIYAVGLPWLYVSFQNLGPAVWQDFYQHDSVLEATIGEGLLPFLVGDALKAIAAGLLLPFAWRLIARADAAKEPVDEEL